MRAAWILVACSASGCMSIDDTSRPWIAASEITGTLAPELGPQAEARVAPTTLRIASWNVERAADPQAIADAILGSPVIASADVIIVQEIEMHPGEVASRAEQVARRLGMTWFYAPARVQGDGTHGDAILSRFPLTVPEVKQLPYVDQPINSAQRIGSRAVLELDGAGRTLTVVNVHLDTRLAPVDRIRQLDPAVSDNPPDVVVGGDLNTLPWVWVDTAVPLVGTEAIIGQDQAQIVDAYLSDLGFDTPVVHDADTHETAIDMRLDALCPRGWRAVAAGVDHEIRGSDHYAVWIDIAAP